MYYDGKKKDFGVNHPKFKFQPCLITYVTLAKLLKLQSPHLLEIIYAS